jgi:predicted enzyme related to lactoylglutathione lyase
MGGRATGIGGVFVRARDPESVRRWYAERLGLPLEEETIVLRWREHERDDEALTIFGIFPADTEYFGSQDQHSMINFRVDDLHALVAELREAGVEVKDGPHKDGVGRFAWMTDPEGNRVELWEPAEGR